MKRLPVRVWAPEFGTTAEPGSARRLPKIASWILVGPALLQVDVDPFPPRRRGTTAGVEDAPSHRDQVTKAYDAEGDRTFRDNVASLNTAKRLMALAAAGLKELNIFKPS